MDHIKILKRALNITVNYRALWIFGMLLALTAGNAGGNGGGGGNSGVNINQGPDWHPPFENFPHIPPIAPAIANWIIGGAIALACLIVLLVVAGIIVRYVSETAAIRMVDRHEAGDERLTVREGFRLGWSRAAWKMFLMDLLLGFGLLLAFLVLLAVAALPLLVWLTKSQPLQIFGSILSAGLGLLLIFATILAALAINLIVALARRACALEDLGVQESLRRGFALVKTRLVDVFLMAVMLFGIGLLWALFMIPVVLAALVAALIVAGLPALLIGGIVGLFAQGATPWIVAGVVGGPIFILAVLLPTTLVGGWQQIFSSSAWTLTYRELVAMEHVKANGAAPAPQVAAS